MLARMQERGSRGYRAMGYEVSQGASTASECQSSRRATNHCTLTLRRARAWREPSVPMVSPMSRSARVVTRRQDCSARKCFLGGMGTRQDPRSPSRTAQVPLITRRSQVQVGSPLPTEEKGPVIRAFFYWSRSEPVTSANRASTRCREGLCGSRAEAGPPIASPNLLILVPVQRGSCGRARRAA